MHLRPIYDACLMPLYRLTAGVPPKTPICTILRQTKCYNAVYMHACIHAYIHGYVHADMQALSMHCPYMHHKLVHAFGTKCNACVMPLYCLTAGVPTTPLFGTDLWQVSCKNTYNMWNAYIHTTVDLHKYLQHVNCIHTYNLWKWRCTYKVGPTWIPTTCELHTHLQRVSTYSR